MMNGVVKHRLHDGIAAVVMDAPPHNTLGPELRTALHKTLSNLMRRQDVLAIALMGKGQNFSSGSDVRAPKSSDVAAPGIQAICDLIETSPVPVVASLDGMVLGSAAEIALAAQFRIGTQAMRFGFPQVTLGIIPSSGATQRLPRLVGAATALNMLMSGQSLGGERAHKAGLIDGLVNGQLASGAVAFAANIVESGVSMIQTRDRRKGFSDGLAYQKAISERRKAVQVSRYYAPVRALDCIDAAMLLPFDAGCEFERAALEDCLAHPQSAALQHVYVAERRISSNFLTRDADRAWVLTPAGENVAVRLRGALRSAVDHIATLGVPTERIDSALLQFGFAKGPYGEGKPGATGRDIELIQRRCVAAVMAEGARRIEAGTITRASDIDALAVHGMGFPRWHGGPMIAAQQMGLLGLRKDMRVWLNESRLWAVQDLVNEAVKYAEGFDAL